MYAKLTAVTGTDDATANALTFVSATGESANKPDLFYIFNMFNQDVVLVCSFANADGSTSKQLFLVPANCMGIPLPFRPNAGIKAYHTGTAPTSGSLVVNRVTGA